MTIQLIQGDCLQMLKTLADESVQCCVTSPPYWNLRDYGVDGQLGLEPTPELYVEHLVAVFREVRRVMRDDAVMFLNLGDSYAGSGQGWSHSEKQSSNTGAIQYGPDNVYGRPPGYISSTQGNGLKPKDLVGIPWRVAFALQADGWWLRQDIIWAKPNPMPESVTDRCTKSHEYLFLLTKSATYYYDHIAIQEPAAYDGRKDTVMKGSPKYANGFVPDTSPQTLAVKGHERWPNSVVVGSPEMGGAGQGFKGHSGNTLADGTILRTRNKRDVWFIATHPFPSSHFAVMPETLVEPCILAGTSEKGCCPKCGRAWVRVVERTKNPNRDMEAQREADALRTGRTDGHISGPSGMVDETTTTGWRPSCTCNAGDPIPCVVCDPFAGSGTVGAVAKRLGRSFIGIELNPAYVKMAEDRIERVEYQGTLI